jgi:2-iminobutanoate/2-iminopropanoate deaminase
VETAAYSPARWAGTQLYVSGQLGLSGDELADGVAAQTDAALRGLEVILAQHGLGRNDVVKVTVYLADMDDWAAMNRRFREFFADPLPARSTVGVRLARGALVEIDAVASA